MFTKVASLLSILLLTSCASSPRVSRPVPPPPLVSSVALTAGDGTAAPILPLNGGSLILRFDVFQSDVSYFRVQVRHLDRTWRQTQILPGIYMRGMHEDMVTEGVPSTSQEPLYTSYTYRFPNSQMGVQVSGNYMMDVIDPQSGAVIISQPFLVTESRGEVDFSMVELFHNRAGVRISHQPFLEYRAPKDFVMPQLDVHVAFAQNRWWSDAVQSELMDQSEDGVLRYYLTRNKAFSGSLDVFSYALSEVGRLDQGVQAADLSARPPSILKDPETDGLTRPIQTQWPNVTGARRTPDARYGRVTFQFETTRAREPMYLVGTFNDWKPRAEHRLVLDRSDNYWKTTVLLKEGTHRFMYMAGNDRYAFTSVMAGSAQEYHGMVYFHDPQNRYDRLLGVSSVQMR